MSALSGIQRAVSAAGGQTALARLLGGKVTRQHVEYWLKAGRVPAEHCPAIESAAGVPCEELNPGVNWSVLRGTSSPTDEAA